MRRRTVPLILVACALALTAASWSAAPAAKGERVTLTLRSDNDAYEDSAYSFRYASQDVRDHQNAVDLIFNACGNLHIAAGGAPNQVAKTDARKLEDVESLPETGWSTECFAPEKGGVYVMRIEGELQKFSVKFRVTEARPNKVVFEWLPLRIPPAATLGTLGQCAGPHDCE